MMTKTVRKERSRDVEHLRKEVERLTAALASVKSQKDAYVLEVRIEDGETFTRTRTYYHVKKDAVNDLLLARTRFTGESSRGPADEPKSVNRGSTELTLVSGDRVFRGTITRIKII